MPELPRGTVTFLFTDVEGSTGLLLELGTEGYADALAEHRRLIREASARHDGVEVDTQGDAFFFAFPTAPGAISAAKEMTEALASGPIRVRIGLHTGTPLLTEEGYVGGDVHRAARIAASGHGGQVLVSSSTAQLVEIELTALGEHRFKDLGAPERVYQLGDGDFPALRSLYRTNLPVPATLEEAEPELTGPDQQLWYERLALEQDNVREALTYACDTGDGERALMLAGTIWRFWWTRGQIAEAERWYERSLAIGAKASELARARGLFGSAHMAEARGDTERACSEFEQSAALLGRVGETRWLILALAHLAANYRSSDPERAESTSSEALALAEASGDVRGAAIVKGNLGNALLERGENHRASELIQDALEGHRALGDVYGMATCLTSLATLALRQGDLDAGAANVRESLRLSRAIHDALTLSYSLVVAAAVVLARGDPRTAARLCAADEALLRVHGFDLEEIEARLLGDTVCAARSSLADDFDDAWAAGASLDLDEAVALALGSLD
jgi:class 3 adenylate cyclase